MRKRQVNEQPRASRPLNQAPAGAQSGRAVGAALAVLLVGMTVAAYFPALQAGFVFDDSEYIAENASLRTAAGLGQIWLKPNATPQYYPLTFTSFWLEYHLWGLRPFGYHLINVLLHALNAVLLWRILRRLQIPGAWVAAAIFALHPIHVQSVAWVTERKNVLSGTFGLAALLISLRWAVEEGQQVPWRFYLAASVLFIASLLSKTVTCTLPVVILLLMWYERGRVEGRMVSLLVPLCLIGLGMAWVTVSLEGVGGHAPGSVWAMSLVERGLVAGRAFWFYPWTLLWPSPLIVIYPRWLIDAHMWWQYLFPLAAVAAAGGLFAARQRIGSGPLVALLCYAVTFAPTSGFFNIAFMRFAFVSDHFAYLPSIPLIVLVAAGGTTCLGRLRSAPRFLTPAIAATVLVVLGGLTARQCTIYHDARTLWSDTLAKNPGCWMAHNNLGAFMEKDGDATAAIGHYQEALRLKPDFGEAHNNLGSALQAQGLLEEAMAQYVEALRLYPNNAEAYNNKGTVLQAQGRLDEAMTQYAEALRWQPTHVKALNNVASVSQAKGAIEEAIAQYERVLELDPDYPEAHNNLASALEIQGKHDAAVAEYLKALTLKPNYPEAHYGLGIALDARGESQEAIGQYREALRLRPEYPEAHNNLATALAAEGKTDEAITHYTQALRLKPEYPEAHNNLGNALRQQGKLDDAIAQYMEAARLRPAYAEAHNNLGSGLAAQGKTEDAITQYAQALQSKPNYAEAHYNLATVLLGERRLDEAKAHFITALQLQPRNAAARNNLGYLLFQQGHSEDAITEYRRALQIDPDYPEAHTNLATALAAEGNAAEAISHYETALRLKPDHAAAHRGLGLVLAQEGQRNRAITELEAALRLDPGDAESRQQLERLEAH